MAVGWMTALKLVPWSGVIEATPQLLQHLAEAQTAKEHVLGRAGELVVAGVEGELNNLFVGGVTGFGLDLKSSMVPVGIAEDRQILRDAETRRDERQQPGSVL